MATKKTATTKKKTATKKKNAPTKDYGRRADYGAPVDAFVASLPPDRRAIVEELRKVVRAVVPGVEEAIKWGMPVFSRGKPICYASAKREYVRFGFYAKAAYDDPDGQLSGSMPAIKIRDNAEIDRKRLTSWLRTALAASP
jgi:hypothetical protein